MSILSSVRKWKIELPYIIWTELMWPLFTKAYVDINLELQKTQLYYFGTEISCWYINSLITIINCTWYIMSELWPLNPFELVHINRTITISMNTLRSFDWIIFINIFINPLFPLHFACGLFATIWCLVRTWKNLLKIWNLVFF